MEPLRIELAEHPEAIAACHGVMHQLRPGWTEPGFVERVQRQRLQGYRLAAAWRADDASGREVVAAVAGFVLRENLAWGRHLYVDDLVVDATFRSSGVGAAVLAWLADHARAAGCAAVHLDSGVQRSDAHRFYLREGLTLSSHHFALPLEPAGSGRPAGDRSRHDSGDAGREAPVAPASPAAGRDLGGEIDLADDPSHEGGLDPDFADLRRE